MHSLFPPLIVGKVNTPSGPKQIAIEAGMSDNIYAIDVDDGEDPLAETFRISASGEDEARPADPLCPGGQTATPVIGPPNASGARTVYAMAGDGEVHSLNVADGEDMAPPFKFGYPNGKTYALNLWNDVLFTTTAQGCAGNPNQMWAVEVDDPDIR